MHNTRVENSKVVRASQEAKCSRPVANWESEGSDDTRLPPTAAMQECWLDILPDPLTF